MTLSAHSIQLREEMKTLDKLNSIESLLTLTKFIGQMKEKSILALFNKIIGISKDHASLKSNSSFKTLLSYIAEGWRTDGVFGPGSNINDRDRISVLIAMENAGFSSKRIFGATTNLVTEGKIDNPDVICTIM